MDSTLGEATTRYMLVKVQQMFTAYRQLLPPRTEPRRPLRLMLFGSLDDYRSELARRGLKIDNPAVYLQAAEPGGRRRRDGRPDVQDGRLPGLPPEVAGRTAAIEGDTAEAVGDSSASNCATQGQQESQIRDTLVREKRKTDKMIQQKVDQIHQVQRKNELEFARAGRRMLSRLYHESFHAYLENYVYPHRDHDVPAWLNEGLAVSFEEGLLESGSLRLGAPNHAALACLKADLAGDDPLTLAQLLASSERNFVVPEGLSGNTNRYYGRAWGLAYYLTFERNLLGTQALDAYVAKDAGQEPPAARFEKLVGVPLAKFEPQWRKFIAGLK